MGIEKEDIQNNKLIQYDKCDHQLYVKELGKQTLCWKQIFQWDEYNFHQLIHFSSEAYYSV